MDSSAEKGSGTLDPDERPPASGETKACTECHTTKTPLWRGGPCGPMSLCNACGIRYRKKRREAMGLDSSSKAGGGTEQQQQRKKKATAAAAAAAASKRERERSKEADEVTVELRAVGFGKEVVLKQRRRMRRRRRLGEEERAAFLLMALSSGVVYA
ncbi:GATA transcription factor 16 isoform X2 [Sorghum bicolor]|uniref:GATA-type domain-containing protein n=1 Tax=Sorghum bicolor TaxID=4558 RepID=A0A1B6QH04_SORBI|nr:GATA transcription factor 16 isoform X2 [Sorghum bicolor]KXG37198.1 hypothetical protein SORBI_3001G023900 [Sorghum bicolor]|eukprot:XP_021306678.1 GATA transcription factor 16 isoform X2 [Sorghum bicolor]